MASQTPAGPPRTAATIVAGGTYAAREARIAQLAAALPAPSETAAILEGLPDGRNLLEPLALRIARLPPGCPCCAGNLVIRVTLNRLLRPAPRHLYLGIADAGHRAALREFLTSGPYAAILDLTDDVDLSVR